jgi:DNA polymerase-3 subunit epsilon
MRICDLQQLGVFDLETTGIDREEDRVVTAYVGLIDRDGNVARSKSWLVNPGIAIPEGASAVHGISTERAVAEGMDAATAIAEIRALLDGRIGRGTLLSAYNASYDFTMLDREVRRHGDDGGFPQTPGMLAFDPLVVDKIVDKYRKGSRKLIDTARYYGVPLPEDEAHDAEADAVATGRLAWKILDRLDQQMTVEELHEKQIVWAAEQAASFQQYVRYNPRAKIPDPRAVIDGRWPIAPFGVPFEHPDFASDAALDAAEAAQNAASAA